MLKSFFKRVKRFPRALSVGVQCPFRDNNKGMLSCCREFMNHFPLPTFETDASGNITFANNKALKLFGFDSIEAVRQKSCFDIVSENNKNRLYENFIKIVRNQSTELNHYLGKNTLGECFPILVNSYPKYKDGDFAGIQGVIIETDHQKSVLNLLQHTELKYLNYIMHSSDSIFLLSQHKIILANNNFAKLFGYNVDELYSEQFNILSLISHKWQNNFLHTLENLTAGKVENCTLAYKTVKKSGQALELEIILSRVQMKNGCGIQGIIKNQNEKIINELLASQTKLQKTVDNLVENETKLKSICDNTSFGVFRIAKQKKLDFYNKALLKILGLNAESETTGRDISSFANNVFEVIGTSSSNHSNEIKLSYLRNNGERAELKINYLCVYEKDGPLMFCDCNVEDITAQIEKETRLMNALHKAEEAERIKANFLAQISHEIRTPIHTILGYTNLLEEEAAAVIPKELRSSFDFIYSAGSRLIRTIDLMVLMSELQSGTYKTVYHSFDLYQDVLEPLYVHYLPTTQQKEITFTINNNCSKAIITADAEGTRTLLSHIIDNAIKYTERGKISLEINDEPENKIAVIIKDTGIGISEKYLKTMFTPFSQEESGYCRSYDGNGLGLAVVNKLAERNKAEITVTSKKGEGTEFVIRFHNI